MNTSSFRGSRRGSRAGWWATGMVIIAAAGLLLFGNLFASAKTNRELALSCTTDALTRFHIHPNIRIVIDGAPQEIPANVGVSFVCMRPIHTHDASGEIHIESPEPRDFTLSDFFAVWRKTFRANQILDTSVDAKRAITVTVNGAAVDTYENTVMHDHDQIVISYGIKQ